MKQKWIDLARSMRYLFSVQFVARKLAKPGLVLEIRADVKFKGFLPFSSFPRMGNLKPRRQRNG